MARESNGFWSTLPGILTGVAAIITALTGAYVAWNSSRPAAAPRVEPSAPTPAARTGNGEQRAPLAHGEPERPAAPAETPGHPATAPVIARPAPEPFPASGPLVDCTQFPTVNTVASLMSWSNHYHKQVVAAAGVPARATAPCNQAIDQRGMAHCKAPDDPAVRAALLDTLTLCRAAGIEWQDIRHSSILGRE